jgi:hypothetical protein
MAETPNDRLHAEREGEFVVFLVGMRINRLWKVHRWLPVAMSAPRMAREQESKGLLGSRFFRSGLREVTILQYWESFEALRGYAREPGTEHRTWWGRFNEMASGDDAVGIWHETYLVRAGEYETVYRHMPASGLGAAEGSELVPATGARESAADRLGRSDGGDAPVAADGGVDR